MLARVARRALALQRLARAAHDESLSRNTSRPLSVAAAHAQAGRRDPVAARGQALAVAAAAAAVAGEPAAGAGADGGAD